MDDLTEPLIRETTTVSTPETSETTSDENDVTRNKERDSSFIEINDPHRSTSLSVENLDTHDVKRRYMSLPVVDPRDSFARNQSIVVAGDDRFIVEEPASPTDELEDSKNYASDADFVNVYYIRGSNRDDVTTSLALEACKKTVLRPYHVFMKLIGWRRFTDKKFDLVQPWNRRILNVIYPVGFFVLLIIGSVAQMLTCFGRGDGYNTRFDIENGDCYFIYANCRDVLITSLIIPGIVIFVAYVFGCYIFRYIYPENLATLTEKVFLDFTANHGAFSQKRLVYSLRAIMLIGIVWQLYAIGLNITRMFSLELFNRHTYVDVTSDHTEHELLEAYKNGNCSNFPTPENDGFRYITVLISVLGLIMTDLFYLAAVIHYALECQLIIFLIRATVDRIKSQCWAVDLAIKEIKVSQDFLNVLNGPLAHMVSLLLFVFAGLWLEATRALYELNSEYRFTVIVTALNVIEWSIVIAIPIVQLICNCGFLFSLLNCGAMQLSVKGVRLTVAGNELETLGQELRTRPFVYRDVPQLDLDSFVMYTSNLNMNAKLINVPLHSSLVLPALFIGAIVWRQLTSNEQIALGRWF